MSKDHALTLFFDMVATAALVATLDLLDVRVLDHIITAGGSALSMAERGLM